MTFVNNIGENLDPFLTWSCYLGFDFDCIYVFWHMINISIFCNLDHSMRAAVLVIEMVWWNSNLYSKDLHSEVATRGVPRKYCQVKYSESIQQIYRRTSTPKCDYNKVAKQLYWNHTSAWVLSCKFAAYIQITFF